MGTKVDRNGETYIVSDDVDVNDLDLEQLTEDEEPVQAQEPSAKQPQPAPKQENENPRIKLFFRYKRKPEVLVGTLKSHGTGCMDIEYKLWIKARDAIRFANVVNGSLSRFGNIKHKVLFFKADIIKNNEKFCWHAPKGKKGKPSSMELDVFRIKRFKGKMALCEVEIRPIDFR